jgi:hypothetical protein
MCGGSPFTDKRRPPLMRRVKLAVIPIAVAVTQLFGPAAANGYFKVR